MKLMGFNFDKISVEKFGIGQKDMKINTNIDLSKIEKADQDFFKFKEEILSVNFTYTVNYAPDIAKIEFKGNLVLAVEPKIAKDVLKRWEEKKIPEEFKIDLFNIILRKSNIRALQLEEEINLPIHIPMPILTPPNKSEK
mgnify:CR=1 FL=1